MIYRKPHSLRGQFTFSVEAALGSAVLPSVAALVFLLPLTDSRKRAKKMSGVRKLYHHATGMHGSCFSRNCGESASVDMARFRSRSHPAADQCSFRYTAKGRVEPLPRRKPPRRLHLAPPVLIEGRGGDD